MLRQIRKSLLRDERGLTTVEYVIVLCLIAAASVGVWGELGADVERYIKSAKDNIAAELDG